MRAIGIQCGKGLGGAGDSVVVTTHGKRPRRFDRVGPLKFCLRYARNRRIGHVPARLNRAGQHLTRKSQDQQPADDCSEDRGKAK